MAVQKITNFKGGAVGNVYRCSIVMAGWAGEHINTFYVRQITSSFTGDVAQDIFQTWDALCKADYLAMFNNRFSLAAFRVQQVDDALKGLFAESLTATGTGTRVVTTDGLPGQCAGLLEFNTGFSGRRGRGRNFIGGLCEEDNADGLLHSDQRDLMEAYGATMLSTFVAPSAIAEWVVWTKVNNTVAVVQSVQAKQPIYTQRRRRQGVGA